MSRNVSDHALEGLERHFVEQVDQWVLNAIRSGVVAFDDLVVALPGVYPAIALESLRRLASAGIIATPILDAALASASRAPVPRAGQAGTRATDTALPLPHPLDYDWRFADGAAGRLLDDALALSQPGDTIALIGVPSVLRAAGARHYPRRLLLLERDASVLSPLAATARWGDTVARFDAHRDASPAVARPTPVVVLDPPWYEEDIQAFLHAATCLCGIGGHVLLSIPPLGTRPGIPQERTRLAVRARALGLDLVRIDACALPYRSPYFERNALAATGIRAIPSEWRRGDLAVFARTGTPPIRIPRLPAPIGHDTWGEEQACGVRFRIHCVQVREESGSANPSLCPLVPGDILPSVSRRDGRRQGVAVWTSGNRVFRCRAPHVVAPIVRAVSVGTEPRILVEAWLGRRLDPVEVVWVSRTEEQLRRIIMRECEEAMRFG